MYDQWGKSPVIELRIIKCSGSRREKKNTHRRKTKQINKISSIIVRTNRQKDEITETITYYMW